MSDCRIFCVFNALVFLVCLTFEIVLPFTLVLSRVSAAGKAVELFSTDVQRFSLGSSGRDTNSFPMYFSANKLKADVSFFTSILIDSDIAFTMNGI